MRYRQVHLDFHTSEQIENVGGKFDRKDFQEKLKLGNMNSITLTGRCAHGWVYYDSALAARHPSLKFDLLQEMTDAAHEIGVRTCVHYSVCLDEKEAIRHAEWLIRGKNGQTTWVPRLLDAGWHRFCLNNEYQEIVVEQIRKLVEKYDMDGLFLDVSSVIPCYCQSCIATIISRGQDPADPVNIWNLAEEVHLNFTKRIRKLVHGIKPGLEIFHNGGYIQRGRRDLLAGDTHLELESLPTGGWGYDHLPLSALYVKNLGMEYLGMTGKFYTGWGEFGSFKHVNGLRYETSQCLAYGAGCSIGDQMHPDGVLDYATYKLIGEVYREVEQKEEYVRNTRLVQDIGILSLEAMGSERHQHNLLAQAEKDTLEGEYHEENLLSRAERSDVGAFRLLRECGYLFDIIDTKTDFSPYKVILIPDYGTVDQELEEKLTAYIQGGGRLYLSGLSGKREGSDLFMEGIPLQYCGKSQYHPLYVKPDFPLDNFEDSAFVVYGTAHRVKAEKEAGIVRKAEFYAPYFNRTSGHFCSHLHAPCSEERCGAAVYYGGSFLYAAFQLFEEYGEKGGFVVKDIFRGTMDLLLGAGKTVRTSLPSGGVTTLPKSMVEACYVHHLLYAVPAKKGHNIENIEDIVPLYDVDVKLRIPEKVRSVQTAPGQEEIAFEQKDGILSYRVPRVECHQMINILCDAKPDREG